MKCLAELEQALAVVEGFRKPTVKYEQYATDAHLAGKNNIQIAFLSFYRPLQQLARTLFTAEQQFDDISGKVIADLGCGPGIFTIGSMLLGSKYVSKF